MAAIHAITLPKWGLEMSEGTVAAWHVAEGAAVEKGGQLCDIETAKIVNTLEADQGGTLRRRLAVQGTTLPVGALIGVMAPAATSDGEIDAFVAGFKPLDASFEPDEAKPVTEAAPAATPPAAAPPPSPPKPVRLSPEDARATNAAAHLSPIARRLADKLGLDVSGLAGSGRKGRISLDDVEAHAIAQGAMAAEVVATPATSAAAMAGPAARKLASEQGVALGAVPPTGAKGRVTKTDVQRFAESRQPDGSANTATAVPFSGMRRAIAQSVQRSKQTVPHFYTAMDVRLDELMALRAKLNAGDAARAKVSVNDILLKAAAMALGEHPDVNVHVRDDGVTRYARADIAIAVAIDDGLIAPVVRDVASKGFRALAAETAALASRARARTLAAEDVADATFTVSNLGMFGVRQFDAIITPPQGAILAVGGARREAYEREGGVAFASVATLTLSADHRAIDGALAARFLATLKTLVEDPLRLVG